MSMKHGLLMSLLLGASAVFGVVGVPVGSSGSLPAAQAATIDTPMPSVASTPVEVSASAVNELVLAANTPVAGVSAVAPAGSPGVLATAAAQKALACSQIYLDFTGTPRSGGLPFTGQTVCQTSLSDGNGGPTAAPAPIISIQWFAGTPAAPNTPVQVGIQNIDPTQPFDAQPFAISFTEAGAYAVGMRVFVQDPNDGAITACPPVDQPPFIKNGFYIVSSGSADPPAANYTATDLICAQESGAIVPGQDWVPVLALSLDFSPENFAPRTLTQLQFALLDQFDNTLSLGDIVEFGLFLDTSPGNAGADQILDLTVDGTVAYEPIVGPLRNFFDPDVVPGKPILRWGSDGLPYEMPSVTGVITPDTIYNLNFTFDPTDPAFPDGDPFNISNPQFPFLKPELNPVTLGPELNWVISWENEAEKWAYILAFRPSEQWPSGQQVRLVNTAARMQPYNSSQAIAFQSYQNTPVPFGSIDPVNPDNVISPLEPITNPDIPVDVFPLNDSGPVDSYSPNFFDGEILNEACFFTSSFDVFDVTGGLVYDSREYPSPLGVVNNGRNPWNWPNKLYTPVTEHTRPRWDLGNLSINFLTGEWMDIRRVISLEEWMPVIGLNMHATAPTGPLFLREVNVILTDVGADPFGPPGNGGLDPRKGLERMTTDVHGNFTGPNFTDLFAVGNDYTFNGVGVFVDTGGGDPLNLPTANCDANGVFDPPTPLSPDGSGAGVSYTDLPLVPEPFELDDFQNEGFFQWEYVPFPVGGGDPWWRMRLRFAVSPNVSNNGDIGARGATIPCDGMFERAADFNADYFVVIRADSGYEDVSSLPGDGTALPFGTDMRAFIEPRTWNPLDGGHWDGGIDFTGRVNTDDGAGGSDQVTVKYWQDSEAVNAASVECDGYGSCQVNLIQNSVTGGDSVQPWFNERTQNADNVKPIRSGVDIHDLTLTYSSRNTYARQSYINVGQRIFITLNGQIVEVPPLQSPANPGVTRTAFGLWQDPGILPGSAGVFGSSFVRQNQVGVAPDFSEGSNVDALTAIQYAYETVPFELPDDIGFANVDVPVSPYYPNPAPQPNLPDYTTWPQQDLAVDNGTDGYCYLASEGTVANLPFNVPSGESEASYRDDEYVFVANDGLSPDVVPGMWLIDRAGGKFRILEVNGNEMTIERGHAAYLDQFFKFRVDPITSEPVELDVPDWPFGVEVGPQAAVARGRWAVVRDTLVRNEYPRADNWVAGLSDNPGAGDPSRAARILKQHVMQESQPTAMLGLNLAGVADPVVNRSNEATLRSITVAFWGPEFDPSDLAALDANGALNASGVLLYEDTNGSGTYDGPLFSDLSPIPAFTDRIVPLQTGSLQWSASAEPVDLDGDFQSDDLSGDGLVVFNNADVEALTAEQRANWDGYFDGAWVLRLQPTAWRVPRTDFNQALLGSAKSAADPLSDLTAALEVPAEYQAPEHWREVPKVLSLETMFRNEDKAGEKVLSSVGNFGDDLFVVVRTSDDISAFEQFRVVVPSKLPTRTPDSERVAGVEFSPGAYFAENSFYKQSPDEGAVQDFYGHDMLEASVPARVIDLSSNLTTNPAGLGVLTTPGGPAVAVLGIDAAANRAANLIAEGSVGSVQGSAFTTGTFTTTPSATYYDTNGWTNAVVGAYLITLSAAAEEVDARVEAYEITAASGNDLTLRSGSPSTTAAWQVVKDPTFLEQVIVEFYDVGRDGAFDLAQDLVPLNFEDPANGQFSGVALYRDNDLNPLNTNGVYDPPITDAAGNVVQYIDLPVRLDDAPTLVGVVGEPEYQVRMVFSSPGTDNSTGRNNVAYESQPNLRQPVPQTFGRASGDPDFGSDFFVVVRTSRNMEGADDFQAAIVSWGPDTPTEPDPDNFSVSMGNETPGQRETEFDLFNEFPSTMRGLGFITFFQNAPPVRYWGFDQSLRKPVPRTEVDRSQDNNTIRYWQRSTANLATRTQTITALPSPQVDFTADRNRQVPGGPIQFTLLVTGNISSVLWNFGDGNTSTATNPTHTYANPGFYDVQVTVRDTFGIEDTVRKEDYIEILDAPFADFRATPTDATLLFEETKVPPIGRDIAFVDLSTGDDDFTAISYFFNFGDGQTVRTATRPTAEVPLTHRYTTTGFFTVTQEVTFRNNTTGATVVRVCRRTNYITIRDCVGCPSGEGEGEGEGSGEGSGGNDPPAADFNVTSEVRDKEAIPPLSNWVPLVNFTMGFGEDDPAPRVLQTLDLLLRSDSRGPEDLGYINASGPDPTDLLEFGLFIENKADDDAKNQELDTDNDSLLYTWSNTGAPLGTITGLGFGSIQYRLDFIGNGTPQSPQFPVPAAAATDDSIEGNSYIIAVRSSATWRSQLTMRCDVLGARMILPTTGGFPVNDEGEPVDSYSPNFYDNERLEEEVGYSSSFSTWSLTGVTGGVSDPDSPGQISVTEYDSWANGRVLYTPLAEHSRPRWNQPGRLLDIIGGEFLELRSLVGQEQWYPVIGINAHSMKTVHIDDFDTGFLRFVSSKDAAQLTEVNVVLTDVGGDPFGTPGNGGFNPVDMLNSNTTARVLTDAEGNFASGNDSTFNGINVWHDTDNDGVFDPPTPAQTGGVTMTGDKSMRLDFISSWEYVPLPPGGGDPWWKIKLSFFGGTRRFNVDDESTEGFLEKTPDRINPFGQDFVGASEYTNDYFVVVRPDSGKQDSSSLSGDGTGMPPGADFKAFIEPRRFNPLKQQTDGGIYLDSMLPAQGIPLTNGQILEPWQDNANWGIVEPWWPQRTVNASNTQKVTAGVEVHDLVMTYETDSDYAVVSDLFFGSGTVSEHSCLGYSEPGDELTDFDRWADPFGLVSSQFLNSHTVGVTRFGFVYTASFTLNIEDQISDVLTFALSEGGGQYAFETVPFNNGYDGVLLSRSGAYPVPPVQPTLPEYASWSFTFKPGELPRLSQWDASQRKARLLTQKTDVEGDVTAMLGINAVGSADPFVARNAPAAIRSITVAFWGPDFKPSDLATLDPNGENVTSGVMLWEDADKSSFGSSGEFNFGLSTGTFIAPTTLQDYLQFTDNFGILDTFDKPVALRNLAWGSSPELIDLNGDGTPDDMDGNGVVDQRDRAWVLTISPKVAWAVPQNDQYDELLTEIFLSCGTLAGEDKTAVQNHVLSREAQGDGIGKALDPTARNTGDDLFITVRTSGQMSRFEKFRAVVPATLPERGEGQRTGGIQFNNMPESSLQAGIKNNPDEDPEQDFYGHDTLEVNVPTRLLDQTNQTQTIVIGGAATPTLALDLATNLDLTVGSGANGVGSDKSFVVNNAAWTPNAFVKAHWLIDSRYEAYQIVGNTATQLTLLSGTPRSGAWRIVKEPSFLEQLIVEFYNEGQDAEFNPAVDLLPLNRDMEVSGIAIYRDNDNNPSNRNGVFDPGIDIPIALDAPPIYIGAAGSDLQAKFVFSSPGTDDYAGARRDGSGNLVAGTGVSLAEQPRNRQWVPDSFGTTAGDPNTGADFFVVVRAASTMTPNDNFRVGIVNWGPNTPSEPDPDTWATLTGPERDDFRKFQEFPWGQRGIGFISFFGTPQRSYYMDGTTAKFRDDNSGIEWVRSHSTKKRRSGVIKAVTRPVNATSLVISSADKTQLPPQILPGETFQVVINGKGFGTRPVVNLSGYTVQVVGATDTAITLSLSTPPPIVPVEPIVLIVRNPDTNDTQSRKDLFTLEQVSTDGPRVFSVNPSRGDSNAFPVTVIGDSFPARENIQIRFGDTLMTVNAVSADGKSASVSLPPNGLPGEGLRSVTVSKVRANGTVEASDTLVNGFDYVNNVVTPTKEAFFFCAPGGPAGESGRGDLAVVGLTLGVLAVVSVRRRWAKQNN